MVDLNKNAEVQRNGHAYKCYVCKKTCNAVCKRCGEFYCSKECQTADWRQHKYICFEMPELIMTPSTPNGQQSRSNRRDVQNVQNGMNTREHQGDRQQSHSPRTAQLQRTPQSGPTGGSGQTFSFADFPKCNDDVVLTAVRFANSFYIRSCSSDSEYAKNVADFDRYGKTTAPKLLSLPQRNDVVLVRMRADGKFQRACVLRVESEANIDVALVDTGRTVSRPLREMRQISEELKRRMRYNFRLDLDHLPNRFDPEPYKKLRECMENGTVFTLKFNGEDIKSGKNFNLLEKESGLRIEMFVAAKSNNGAMSSAATTASLREVEMPRNQNDGAMSLAALTDSLRDVEMPTIQANVPEKANVPQQPMTTKLVPPKKYFIQDIMTATLPHTADLLITDNTNIKMGYVSAVSTGNSVKLLTIHNNAQEYGNASGEVYTPVIGEICLVLCEDEWYRAAELDFQSKFLLIDWGTLVSIEPENIRKLPEQLTEPCHTFTCNIEGFTQERIKHFEELLPVDLEKVHSNSICVKADGEDLAEYNVTFGGGQAE